MIGTAPDESMELSKCQLLESLSEGNPSSGAGSKDLDFSLALGAPSALSRGVMTK
jgi:hypothetical protein